jgi:hypothetical protein
LIGRQFEVLECALWVAFPDLVQEAHVDLCVGVAAFGEWNKFEEGLLSLAGRNHLAALAELLHVGIHDERLCLVGLDSIVYLQQRRDRCTRFKVRQANSSCSQVCLN